MQELHPILDSVPSSQVLNPQEEVSRLSERIGIFLRSDATIEGEIIVFANSISTLFQDKRRIRSTGQVRLLL